MLQPLLRLVDQRRFLRLFGDGLDDLEEFFFALYSVAASLTLCVPCSLGKVSTITWAGLTNP